MTDSGDANNAKDAIPDWQRRLQERTRLAYETALENSRSRRAGSSPSSKPGEGCCGRPSSCVPANGRCRARDAFMDALKNRDPDEFERQQTRFRMAGGQEMLPTRQRTRDLGRDR